MNWGQILAYSLIQSLVVGALVYLVSSINTTLKWRRIYAYSAYRKGIRIALSPTSRWIIDGWYRQEAHRRHIGIERIKARHVIAAYERTIAKETR